MPASSLYVVVVSDAGSAEVDVLVERELLRLGVLALLDGGQLQHVKGPTIAHCGGQLA